MKTPVLFIIFRRMDTAQKVFNEIRKAKPEMLFVAADAARPGKPGESEQCEKLRNWVIENIDWECELKTLFQEKNLGCGMGVKTAIDWFFENVEEGIILEDDCVPHQDFFYFCSELLEYYRYDTRITCISGNNFQFGREYGDASYYFSRYPNTWGWASWRRAWKIFDFDMKTFTEFKKEKIITRLFPEKYIQKRWLDLFQKVYNKNPNFSVWDIQWTYAAFINNTLSISPQNNMVSNIGTDSTHEMKNKTMKMPIRGISNIKHPDIMVINTFADKIIFNLAIIEKNIFVRVFNKIRKYLRKKIE